MAVDDVRARLTLKENWITSRAEGLVLETLKLPDWLPMKVGDRISFENDGGELVVDGVIVTATVSWARPVQPLKRYLVFAAFDNDTKALVIGPTGFYEVAESSGQLRRLGTTRSPDGIEQALEGDVLTTLRQLAARPR
jgi:hypothetical protein